MKKVILGIVFATVLVIQTNASTIINDSDLCFDAAIESLELAEERLGGMMDDESATEYLNFAYAECWLWMAFN